MGRLEGEVEGRIPIAKKRYNEKFLKKLKLNILIKFTKKVFFSEAMVIVLFL